MKKFIRDRDEALLSMDRDKILAYAKKYGVKMPEDEDVFWIGVHKARTGNRNLPLTERLVSKVWLQDRGFSSMDGGDLP